MERDNTVITDRSACAVSWSAIIAGALVAFSLSALFNLLNTGLGLVTFPESFRAMTALTVGGYVWLVICGIIAMFIAGFVAGKILRQYSISSCGGFLHGFLAFSVALLLTVMIAAHFAQASMQAVAAAAEHTQVHATTNMDQAEAQQRAEQAATALGGATLGIFFIFLFGAAAASVGGYIGAKRDSLAHTHTRL